MRYGCKKPIIFILIAMALLLTGCGNKAKEVEYITTDTSEKGIHGIDSFPGMDNSKRVWDDQYAIGDTPVEMNVRNIYYDQNPIYQRRIIPIDRNDIRGDIIASQIFGDSTSV